MISVGTMRIALAGIGLVIFGWGVRIDDPNFRLAGILLLVGALALRFVKRGPSEGN